MMGTVRIPLPPYAGLIVYCALMLDADIGVIPSLLLGIGACGVHFALTLLTYGLFGDLRR